MISFLFVYYAVTSDDNNNNNNVSCAVFAFVGVYFRNYYKQ